MQNYPTYLKATQPPRDFRTHQVSLKFARLAYMNIFWGRRWKPSPSIWLPMVCYIFILRVGPLGSLRLPKPPRLLVQPSLGSKARQFLVWNSFILGKFSHSYRQNCYCDENVVVAGCWQHDTGAESVNQCLVVASYKEGVFITPFSLYRKLSTLKMHL